VLLSEARAKILVAALNEAVAPDRVVSNGTADSPSVHVQTKNGKINGSKMEKTSI